MAFGYTLFFQIQWTKKQTAIAGEFNIELHNVGLVLGSLARGFPEGPLC